MANGDGRPLKALAVLLGGWVAVRVALLWPETPRILLPPAEAEPPALIASTAARPSVAMDVPRSAPEDPPLPRLSGPPPAAGVPATLGVASALRDAVIGATAAEPDASEPSALVRFGVPEPAAAEPSRWSGSAWAILRGSGATGVATPQLGGSQAGVRIAYALDDGGRVTLAARAAGALRDGQQEGAVGIEWRPTRLPLRLVAEQRIAITNARGGASLAIVGGVAGVPVAAGASLDGYVQAGLIARDGGEGYADGAIRIGRKVAATRRVALDLGAGAWGAAQRGAEHLDVGPSAAVTFPIGDRRARLSLDWRQRMAGRARPGSGLALSLGTDF